MKRVTRRIYVARFENIPGFIWIVQYAACVKHILLHLLSSLSKLDVQNGFIQLRIYHSGEIKQTFWKDDEIQHPSIGSNSKMDEMNCAQFASNHSENIKGSFLKEWNDSPRLQLLNGNRMRNELGLICSVAILAMLLDLDIFLRMYPHHFSYH